MNIDYVYWTKVFTAAVYGYVSALAVARLQTPLFTYLFLLLSILIYLSLAEALWRFSGMAVKRRQSYLNGAGGYAGVYLLTWMLFFNLVVQTIF